MERAVVVGLDRLREKGIYNDFLNREKKDVVEYLAVNGPFCMYVFIEKGGRTKVCEFFLLWG